MRELLVKKGVRENFLKVVTEDKTFYRVTHVYLLSDGRTLLSAEQAGPGKVGYIIPADQMVAVFQDA